MYDPFDPLTYRNAMLASASRPSSHNALAPPPKPNAMAALDYPAVIAALDMLARAREPEVPEADRKRVAWTNLTGSWDIAVAVTREGRCVIRDHHGDRDSEFGWEVGHYPVAKCFGGRYTQSNIIAQHWRDNASDGGGLSQLLQYGR